MRLSRATRPQNIVATVSVAPPWNFQAAEYRSHGKRSATVACLSGLADVKINRQEVTHAAAEHEAVPDSVVIRNTFADVEDDPSEYTTPPTASSVTPPTASFTAS